MCNRLTLPIALLSVVAGGLLAGCAQSDVSWQGSEDKLVKKVKPGQTTEAEVIALFGKPLKVETTASGSEVLQYQALKTKSDALASPVGPAETFRQERYFYFFEVNNGLVTRAWKNHETIQKSAAVNQPLFYPAGPAVAPGPMPARPLPAYGPPPSPAPAPVAAPQPTGAAPPPPATAVAPPPAGGPPPAGYAPSPYLAQAYYYPAPPMYYYPAPAYYYYPGPVVYSAPWPYVGLNLGFRFGWRR